jgi:penicillin-binding protein 1C
MTSNGRSRPFFVKKAYRVDHSSVLHRVPFATAVGGGRPPRKPRLGRGAILRILGILAVFGIIGGLLGTAIVFAWVSRDLPDPNKLLTREVEKSTKIWDRTGQHLLYEIHGAEKRTLVELDQIAPAAVQATLASEDKNFYLHKGFRIQSFIRAAIDSVLKRQSAKGTSTITQQLVKNAVLSPERTLTRKVKELILSYQIEKKFTKDQILKMYFNEIPYGSTSYGIESAAQAYFAKSARDLDAAESALLSAMLKAPTRRSPYGSHKDELVSAQKHVLDLMAEQGFLTKEQAEEAKAVDILARVKPRRDAIFAPHFSLLIKEQLAERFGEREVEEGGLSVITTLDYDKQVIAEEAVTAGMEAVKKFGGSNAALVALDPKTGQVLAMVGSADYFDAENDGNVNVAIRNRQPGSSFKPIVYAAAFEKGYTPDTVLFDVNTSFSTDLGKPYEPKNYDLAEHGPVTIRKALAGSLNIPAVKALYLVGVEKALDLAGRMGYSTFGDRSRFGLSLVLGGGEVKLIEHTAGYAVFATEGTYRPPSMILKVEDARGEMLDEWRPQETPEIISAETARNITDILSDNEARSYVFGESNFLTLGDRPAAAKTGTTNGFHDAWTLGYTPSLVAGVWVGNNDNAAMKNKADGSRVAAPIWKEFMKKSLDGSPIEEFVKPTPIVTGKPVLDGQAGEIRVNIDKFSGKLATELTPPTAIEQRVYRQAHDILYYVDKDDPRGPYPADAWQDPQFEPWEKAVQEWAKKNNWVTTDPPPSEIDDMHREEFAPTVFFQYPMDGATIEGRSFLARVDATSLRGISRVEYRIEGVLAGTADAAPWETTVTVPDLFGKGFYTLQATAFDDIENNATRSISVNVLSDGRPLSISWTRPATDVSIRLKSFPMFIDASLSSNAGVSAVDIGYQADGKEPVVLATVNTPKTNGVSATWETPSEPGTYRLFAKVRLVNGEERRIDGPDVTVKP